MKKRRNYVDNNTTPDIERDRIYASDKDPMEELAELRAQGAIQDGTEQTEEYISDNPPEETEAEATETDDLEAFEAPDDTAEEAEEEEEDTDEESKEETEDDEDDKEADEAETTSSIYKFKANGQDFEFTQEEINAQFGTVFGKAMDYTQKMQKISPYRKMVSALEDENISQNDLNLAIDVLKGDKGALQKLIAERSIDIYDLDTEGETGDYQAKDYGKNEHELQLEDIDRQISADPEYPQTIDIVGKQWDERSRQTLSDNPEWISGLHADVKSGVFAKVSPEAAKMKMLDGGKKPDIEYYLMAGQQLSEKGNATPEPVDDPVEKATQQFKDDSAAANKKRSASATRSRVGSKGVVDYLDDNDEKFDSWYDNIMKNS
jgi:hypothetical protein